MLPCSLFIKNQKTMREYEKGSATTFMVALIVFLALVVLGIFAYSISKENAQKKQVEQEIATLRQQASSIQKENMALADRISYLSSEEYQKMQAKDKLNLQSPGENVVIIAPRNATSNGSSQGMKTNGNANVDNSPNPQKWWNYFFKS